MIVNRDPKPDKPAFSMSGSSTFGFRPDYRNTYQDRASLQLVVARGRSMYECSERPNKTTLLSSFRGTLSVETFNDAMSPTARGLAVFDQYDVDGDGNYLSLADQLRMIAYLPSAAPPFAKSENLISGDSIVATDERLPDTTVVTEFSFEPVVASLVVAPTPPAWAPAHWSGIALSLRFQDTKTQITVFFCRNGTGENDAWLVVAGPPDMGGDRKPFYEPDTDIPNGINTLQFNWCGGAHTYTLGYGEECGLYLMVDNTAGVPNGLSQLLLWDPNLSILGGDVNTLGDWIETDAKVSAIFAHASEAGVYEELYLNFLRLYNYGSRAVYGKYDESAGLGLNTWLREIPNWGTEYPPPRGEKGLPWEVPQPWSLFEINDKIGRKELSNEGVRIYKDGYGPCYFFRNEPELQSMLFGTTEPVPPPDAARLIGGVWSVFPGTAWAIDVDFYASQVRADPSAGANTGMGISIVDGDPVSPRAFNFRLLTASGGKYLGLQKEGTPFSSLNYYEVDREQSNSDWGVPRRLRLEYNPLLDVVSVLDRDVTGMPIYYETGPKPTKYTNHVDSGVYLGFLDAIDSEAFMTIRSVRVLKRLVSYEAWWDVLGGAGTWTPDAIAEDELKWTRVITDGTAVIEHPNLKITKPQTFDSVTGALTASHLYYKRIDPMFDNLGWAGFSADFVLSVIEHVSENNIANGFDSRLGVGVGINIPVVGLLRLVLVNLKPYGPALVVEQDHKWYDATDEDAFWKLVMAYDESVLPYILMLDWKQRREIRVVYDPVYGLTLYIEDRRALDLTSEQLKLLDVPAGTTSFQFGSIIPTTARTVTNWERFTISFASGNDYVLQSAIEDELADKVAGGREVLSILSGERYVT